MLTINNKDNNILEVYVLNSEMQPYRYGRDKDRKRKRDRERVREREREEREENSCKKFIIKSLWSCKLLQVLVCRSIYI